MRQTVAVTEKVDPLTRIQEEIKEVERREQEYRQLITSATSITVNECDGNDTGNILDDSHNDSLQSLSPVPPALASSLSGASEDCNSNMPSLALSVNSGKDDGHHSDDSGISASSSPVNGVSANIKKLNEACKLQTSKTSLAAKENRYKGPNCYTMRPEPPQQKLMTRTVSTPMLSAIRTPRQFTINPAHKGVMQRFIASRGKIHLNNPNSPLGGANKIYLNGKNAAAMLGLHTSSAPNTPMSAGNNLNGHGSIPSITLMPPVIVERDMEGRSLRPGYVPVELKIQRELKDLKSRESELKKIRKIRQSTPDLLDALNNEMLDTDEDDEDSEVEHCYGPGKLRAAKSIGDMCDGQSNQSQSASPMLDYERTNSSGNGGGMRPAVSLAMLCDLDPEEAPSSRGLIAQWENLIQQNA